MLQALAHHAAGDLPEALAALGRALGGAPEPDSYVRLFLDEGAPMLTLLQQAASDPAGEKVQGQVRRLLDRAQAPVDDAEPQQSLADPLSQRELEVLRLLDSELTGPRDRARALRHAEHAAHPHEAHLHQARRQDARGRRTHGPRARAHLSRSLPGVTP